MSKSNHPIEQEELMAYLDGELATDRAVATAAHLEHCAECQELAADLKKLAQELMAWEVEDPGITEIATEVAVALEKRKKGPKKKIGSDRLAWGMLVTPRRIAWAGGLGLIGLLVISISIPNMLRSPQSAQKSRELAMAGKESDSLEFYNGKPPAPAATPPPSQAYTYDTFGELQANGNMSHTNGLMQRSPAVAGKSGTATEQASGDDKYDDSERTVPTVPMIARTAALTLTTKEFDNTRSSLEEILKRHGGYLGELKVSAPADAGRTLTATLRIPAPQLESTLAELKKLGRVEDESQGGEEVTQQFVDLQARLANSKHTEQRLTEILRQRTGKLQDVLKVELEIDRVRGEIEQMQAEKKELNKRVAFATLNTMVKEEYRAKLQATPPSTGSRFRNAAVDGYNTVVEGLIDIGLFLLSAGPSLLLWAAILFFPARWAWKKLRAAHSARSRGDTEEEQAG